MNSSASRTAVLARTVVLIGIVAGFVLAGSPVMAGQAPPQGPRPAGCSDSLPAIYSRLSPAVVSITAISINPYDADHRIERVGGSGVIIESSGLILSNSHVVFGRQVISVTLDDGTTLPAKLVGADPVFDIALLRIPPPTRGSLPIARLGDSGALRVGEEVYAIGNPLGLDQTLTRGIVSAVNRTLPGAAWSLTEPLIQTDAAINPGNSGGPLVDSCGNVVGITTAILSEAQSIGFAVPADLIREVVPQLIERGHLVRPWLGVQGQFVVPALKELLRVSLVDGFLVEAVDPGSPAEQSGIAGGLFEITIQGQPILLGGDIITQINGVAIDDPGKLAKTLGELRIGTTLKLTAVRDGKARTVELALSERPVLLLDMPGRRSEGGPGTTAGTPVRGKPGTGRTILF